MPNLNLTLVAQVEIVLNKHNIVCNIKVEFLQFKFKDYFLENSMSEIFCTLMTSGFPSYTDL